MNILLGVSKDFITTILRYLHNMLYNYYAQYSCGMCLQSLILVTKYYTYAHPQEVSIFVRVVIRCAYVTRKIFHSNHAHFSYVASSRFIFLIQSNFSSSADRISVISSRVLSLTNECFCQFCSITPNCHPHFQSNICIFANPFRH